MIETHTLTDGRHTVVVTVSQGPRVLSFTRAGGPNLFAEELPDELPCEGAPAPYCLLGGHRLWVAPEVPPRTYWPDNEPVMVTETPAGIRFAQPAQAGFAKALTVRFIEEGVEVTHTLTNAGPAAVEVAPWAITQFAPGGTAILPQPAGPVDPYGVLPNRRLAFWPYSRLDDPRVEWGPEHIRITADDTTEPFKVGFANPAGWLAYEKDGVRFTKRTRYDPDATYPDLDTSSQCYVNGSFLELETLGPLTMLAPGASITHVETWSIT